MSIRIRLFFSFTLVFLLWGCVKAPSPKPQTIFTVAVLPFDSESNDINAPDILQRLVTLALQCSSYKPLDMTAVNDKLKAAGIVDGGQLAVVDPIKLGKDLGVQGLIFGNVETFQHSNVGFYLQRKVRLELKLVEVSSGQTLWEDVGTGIDFELNLEKDKAKNAWVRGVAEQWIEKLAKHPLDPESKLATMNALKTLPGFRFGGFGPNEPLPEARSRKRSQDSLNDLFRKR